jgi:mannan endo-1,4-beta-mannosidase
MGGGSGTADAGDARASGDTGGPDVQKSDSSLPSDTGSCKAATAAQAPSGVTPFRAIDGFVTREGSSLTLCGQPFSVFGTNLYYLQSYSVYEAGNLRTVADGLDDAVRMSLPVVRMWAYYDGAGSDSALIQTAPGKYSETALVGLDTAIAEAKKRGIRVILTLTDYWTGYGGLPQYATWAGATGANDFYANTTMQGYYKDYATMLSKRTNTVTGVAYVDEPAILAWEIANELRCEKCPISTMLSTIDTMSTFLKGLFPKQLIADGGEGFDDHIDNYATMSNEYVIRGDEGASYTSMVALPSLDMASYHYYPVDWGLTAVDADGQAWVDGHEAIAKAAGKVAYWGEFGYQKGATDAVRAPIYDTWLTAFYGATDNGALAMFWQLVPQSRGADDGFACILGRDPATVAVFEKYSVSRAPR